MAWASLKDLYLAELADLYAAEAQMLRALPRLADAARASELRDLLQKHYEESRLHLERLQLIFTHWGERFPAAGSSVGIAGIVQQAEERLNEQTTDDVRDAAIIGAVQRAEHYEIAVYGCARTYAHRLSRPDEARLLQETLDEEGRTDHRLTELAEAHINDDARAETDFAQTEPRTRFRYIDRRQLDYSRLTESALQVCNTTDEDLGTFDGLVITSSAAPRYIVVDGRLLFSGRRYLLPVNEVTFDDRARVLRVNLSKDLAERYPEFDPAQFEAMDGTALRGYDEKLMAFFQRDSAADQRVARDAAPPEWLMTGVWITVTPDRAAGLSEAARSFANEFSPASVQRGREHENRSSGGDRSERETEPVDVAGPAEDIAGPGPGTPDPLPPRNAAAGERLVAQASSPDPEDDDTTTPPHGDKLRDKAR